MCHFFFLLFFFLCFYAIWEQIDGKRGKIRVWFWMTNASRRHWLKSQHMSRLSQSHATSMIHCPITLCYWFLVQCRFEGGVTQPENGEFFFYTLVGRVYGEWQTNALIFLFIWCGASHLLLACMSCSVRRFARGSVAEWFHRARIMCELSLLCKSGGSSRKISLIWLDCTKWI